MSCVKDHSVKQDSNREKKRVRSADNVKTVCDDSILRHVSMVQQREEREPYHKVRSAWYEKLGPTLGSPGEYVPLGKRRRAETRTLRRITMQACPKTRCYIRMSHEMHDLREGGRLASDIWVRMVNLAPRGSDQRASGLEFRSFLI